MCLGAACTIGVCGLKFEHFVSPNHPFWWVTLLQTGRKGACARLTMAHTPSSSTFIFQFSFTFHLHSGKRRFGWTLRHTQEAQQEGAGY